MGAALKNLLNERGVKREEVTITTKIVGHHCVSYEKVIAIDN